MEDKSERQDPETPRPRDLPEDVRMAWIRAYQEAQRQVVESHATFQRAMAETQTQFLKTVEASLVGLSRVLAAHGVPLPEPPELEVAPSAETVPAPAVEEEPAAEAEAEEPPEEEPPAADEPPEEEPAADEPTDDEPAAVVVPPSAGEAGTIDRHALQEVPMKQVGLAISGLASVGKVAITDDGTGVARALAEQLAARGVEAEVVDEPTADAPGVVFLGGLAKVKTPADVVTANLRAFRVARAVAPRFTTSRGVFVTVQDTGGDFGLGGAGLRSGLGGIAGLAKTAAREWPSVTVKAIDLERGDRPAWKLAKVLAEELFAGGPEREVGLHADGTRVVLEAYKALLHLGGAGDDPTLTSTGLVGADSVVVATGTDDPVTARCLEALAAKAGPRILLVDAAPVSVPAAEARAALADALREAGSEVRDAAVDPRDRDALAAELDEARSGWGPITGLVIGAPRASGQLLAERSEEAFAETLGARVTGLYGLLDATADDPLELMFFFAPAATRCGRRGEAEATMAGEVWNKVAAAEHARRGAACLVRSLNWAPWEEDGDGGEDGEDGGRDVGGDKGDGRPVSPSEGVRAFLEELRAAVPEQVEVLIGDLPRSGPDALPLHDAPRPRMLTMDAFVSAATHPYLEGCRQGAHPELPQMLVLEWFSRIARAHFPDLEVVACRELKAFERVRLRRFYEGGDAFTVVSHQGGQGTRRELQLELYATDGSLCCTAVADVAPPGTMSTAPASTARMMHLAQTAKLRPWPFSKVYGHALFQGPEFQMIREVSGVTDRTLVAVLAGTREMAWSDTWLTDVAALEGGLQLALLWYQYQQGGSSQPASIGAYYSHFSGLAEGPIQAVLEEREADARRVVCDVAFVNENGTLLAELRGVIAEGVAEAPAPPAEAEPAEEDVTVDVDEPLPDESELGEPEESSSAFESPESEPSEEDRS